ncbi:CRTAC1 family protein [Fuscibacter oryzae]|uniref:CRTAC1 family protein n=1 Tax=Fuscibacter oryzae TaxID=2803939 RepID=A0A8J7MWD0_9RHOB|nr:CRTAC1 family protein [Fuscibacter oryzae]MBL4929099.1 CRTAC1 family protein [Fuscibacter oryzae]
MRMLLVLAFAASPALAQTFAPEPSAGLTTPYQGDWQYMVGGGVAVFDCDGDLKQDVFVAGGEGKAGLYRNISAIGGDLRFQPVDSGLEMEAVTGAWPLDIDADGLTDLAVMRVGQNRLMKGLGGCKFRDASADWGFDGGDGWSTAFSATWEKGATWPTLAVGNYIDRTQDAFPWGSCTENWLHRPAGATGFAPALPLKPSYCALSILFSDWSGTGKVDLRVSNDREYYKGGQEQLWHIEPGQPPALYTEAEGWKRLRIWGMGIASRDLDANGTTELFLTSMADNKLQSLNPAAQKDGPKPVYDDTAFARGVTSHRPYTGDDIRPSTAWHAEFSDVNNDGLDDLFVAKGNVDRMPDFAQNDPNNLLMQGADGKFVEMGDKAGVADMGTARGAALADFNLDGLPDLVVVDRREAPKVWRNTTAGAGGFVALWLADEGANRDAIGAWIELRVGDHLQRREVTVGGGHGGGQLGWQHFGLGKADQAEVRVIWPDGVAGDWQPLAGGFYRLTRGGAERITP